MSSTQHKQQEDFDILEQEVKQHEIILFNDDVNTFEHVIESLIDVCNHSSVQAEQCAYIVHYKGKCAVKTGEYDELKPRCSRLLELGLSAEIV
ncbi:ATP-dependent Clp protease adaptor ClpS [Aureibaculum sp. 2210JD6-5]|uniref:ATP-dependent Clp protease adaptor ClpS n=1 Tax=Aureibaculum sp. 2210JD6-5 TaxID=3103957 RepID=UPI002AAE0178|nr:ATP-dependent Clp protease adaptor ClpS [Aureibaculum sp. 2210JD6-5]MDY7394872.1 ATP-dependent Clp protease adaptor ClpS [Aureibaculum sp. 2210JD6-5]